MKTKKIKSIAKKITIFCATITIVAASFGMTAFAGLLGSDSISSTVYDTPCTGTLYVYDDHATSTTSYSRNGSNIYINVALNAQYRYSGKDTYLSDYDQTSGGGATAKVDLDLNQYPNAVFLSATGSHEVRNYVNGMLLPAGYWLDSTRWVR